MFLSKNNTVIRIVILITCADKINKLKKWIKKNVYTNCQNSLNFKNMEPAGS